VVDPTDPKVGTWVPSGGANLSVPDCVGCLDGGGLPARCVCEGPPQPGAFCKAQAFRPKGRAGEGEACTALCTPQDYHADPSSGDSSRYRCAAGGRWEHVSGELNCLEGPAPKQLDEPSVWEWLGPVLGGILLAVLAVLAVVVSCCRRRRSVEAESLPDVLMPLLAVYWFVTSTAAPLCRCFRQPSSGWISGDG
jgi:hypothetical protein